MGKWDAPSDLDYYDEPWAASTPCKTPDCSGVVSSPQWNDYCPECHQRQLDNDARYRQSLARVEAALAAKERAS